MNVINRLTTTVAVLLIILLLSCSNREIGDEEIQERNGIFYATNEDEPYTGKVIGTYSNGNRYFTSELTDGKGDGKHTQWYENGQKKVEENYQNGDLDGLALEWYANGSKSSEIFYSEGIKDGVYKTWDMNGQPVKDGKYDDDIKDDIWKSWFDNGRMEFEKTFSQGKQNGTSFEWYKNGQKKVEENYKDGDLDGLALKWYENGQLSKEKSFISGIQSSEWKTWTKDNGEFEYKLNRLVSITKSGNKRILGKVEDLESNVYSTIQIGNQEWMTENLNVEYFRNGDKIPRQEKGSDWKRAQENEEPAWCYYGNSESNGMKYGKLYNWYAVNDSRGLAPEGWHIPSESEFKKLQTYVNDKAVKLIDLNEDRERYTPTNETGFSALFAGFRYLSYGSFDGLGYGTYFWSSTEHGSSATSMYLSYSGSAVDFYIYDEDHGFSIRCLKD